MKGSQLLGRIRTDLNDPKGKRWSDPYLLDVASDFLLDVAATQPRLFTVPRNVILKAGELTDLSECCLAIVRVDGIVDDTNTLLKVMHPQSKESRDMYRRPACLPKHNGSTDKRLEGAPTNYTIDPDRPTWLLVNPPVPAGKSFKARVWCTKRPDAVTMDSDSLIPFELLPALFRYVKAVALGAEQESVSSQSVSSKDEVAVDRSLQRKNNAMTAFIKGQA